MNTEAVASRYRVARAWHGMPATLNSATAVRELYAAGRIRRLVRKVTGR